MIDALLRPRLDVAARLDRAEAIVRRVGERIGYPQAWLQELHEYRSDPRMALEEFWVRFTIKRMSSQGRFDAVKDQATAEAFYRECDYMLWRNLVHRRHSAWRRVLVTMTREADRLLEFGCGIAPVTAYVSARKPKWTYALVDLESPHRDYGVWRVRRGASSCSVAVCPSDFAGTFGIITALDVMEHLADPLPIVQRLVKKLAPGGLLHWNFVGNVRRNDMDLATEEQQAETVAWLGANLRLVWEQDGYRVSRKR